MHQSRPSFALLYVSPSLTTDRAELTELMALADRGRVELITVEYRLAEASKALPDLNAGKIHGRAVLIP